MAENICYTGNLPVYVNSDSRHLFYSSHIQQAGSPIQMNRHVAPLIPVNFVPFGQQLSLFQRAGYQGFPFDVVPGQFVFVPHIGVRQNSIDSRTVYDGTEEATEWNQAFSRISEITDSYFLQNRISHFARDQEQLTPIETRRDNINLNGDSTDLFTSHNSQHIEVSNMQSEYSAEENYHTNGYGQDGHQSRSVFNQSADHSFVENETLTVTAIPQPERYSEHASANDNWSTGQSFQENRSHENIYSLENWFQNLLNSYLNETKNWIQHVVFQHPRQTRTRSLLGVISALVSESVLTVSQTVLNGFVSGVLIGQNYSLRQISETLQRIESSRRITYNTALFLRAHARIFNIFLSPVRLLGRFAEVVDNTTRWMIINQQSSIPDVLPW